jgi:hypothetical protein
VIKQIEDVLGIQPKERKRQEEPQVSSEVPISHQVEMNSAFASQEESTLEEMR